MCYEGVTLQKARKKVVADNQGWDFFIERLGLIIRETQTQCLAWAMYDMQSFPYEMVYVIQMIEAENKAE